MSNPYGYDQQPPHGGTPGGGWPQQPAQGYPPQGGGSYPYGYPSPGTPPRGNNTLALVSMILGLVAIPGLCLCGLSLPLGIAAVVCGHLGKNQIRREHSGGDGMALTGLITGYIMAGLSVAFFVLYLAAPGIVDANMYSTY